MSHIYLAYSTGGSNAADTFQDWDWEKHPVNVLVSFYYLSSWNAHSNKYNARPPRLMLDSGAYTAWNAGHQIDLSALIKETKNPCWTESVALDVIGDADGSLKNARQMRIQGSPAFPVYHYGEPIQLLKVYCREFAKVGLSCRFGEPVPQSMQWLQNCFKECYPHKFHSFGWTGEEVLKTFPFHSADSTSWMTAHRFGRWKNTLGGALVPNSWKFSLKGEILKYLQLERFLKARWKKELARLPE